MHPQYPEYRPPSQRDLNRAHLRRILLWLLLAVVLGLAALALRLPDVAKDSGDAAGIDGSPVDRRRAGGNMMAESTKKTEKL